MAEVASCRKCALFFGDADVEMGRFNPRTGLCLGCTRQDAEPCFAVSYDGADPVCGVQCEDAPLCSVLVAARQAELPTDPASFGGGDPPAVPAEEEVPLRSRRRPPSELVNGRPPSYRSRSVHRMKKTAIGYQAWMIMREWEDGGREPPYYYRDLLPPLRERCPGTLRGHRPETGLRTILVETEEIEAHGAGFFSVVEEE